MGVKKNSIPVLDQASMKSNPLGWRLQEACGRRDRWLQEDPNVDSFPLVTRKRRSALGVVVVAVGVIGVTTSAVSDDI